MANNNYKSTSCDQISAGYLSRFFLGQSKIFYGFHQPGEAGLPTKYPSVFHFAADLLPGCGNYTHPRSGSAAVNLTDPGLSSPVSSSAGAPEHFARLPTQGP